MLAKRYPQLAFLLQVGDEGASYKVLESRTADEARLPSLAQYEEFDVVYVYGLGYGEAYVHFSSYLEEHPQAQLVLIDEDLAALRLFLTSQHAERCLTHPRVHLRFFFDYANIEGFAASCAADFPFEHIDVQALPAHKQKKRARFYRIREALFRATTVEHALLVEGMHYHLLAKNFFPNYLRFACASSANDLRGSFSHVPAVICGAGPSLEDEIENVRALEQRALVIAGGSAITALSRRGICPHLAVAIDPNREEVARFRDSVAFEVPLLYVNRVHPGIFETCNGPLGYLHTLVGGPAEMWMEKKLGIAPPRFDATCDLEALSVTTTAIELAYAMGCSPIILVGVDLALTDQAAYVEGVVATPKASLNERKRDKRVAERLLQRKGRLGKPVYTLVKWVMEAGAIARFAARATETVWINATAGGLGFEGIPYRSLSEVAWTHHSDLRGKLSALLEENRFDVTEERVNAALLELKKSMEKALCYAELALQELTKEKATEGDPETGRLIFTWLELEELDAYQALLKPAILSLERTCSVQAGQSDQGKRRALEDKWRSLYHLAHFYLDRFASIDL